MTQLDNDNYGRTVNLDSSNGIDTYTVLDSNNVVNVTISVPSGTDQSQVYNTINSLSPSIGEG